MAESEIADLLQRIDQEYQAAQWALTGLAYGTARHDFINERLENLHALHEQVIKRVGPAAAPQFIARAYSASSSQDFPP
ncbi:hypothetical protein EPA93_32615 [Ktedonosporobacter rubrisoli]|uniref:Uncharacterized protein n=1 Tax=Ktedonosporobacter rubrisoli TaxID=2509675 RepID=A0A4P6JYA7_KTERU|nr:hypothetical protein [Ktedonosporobacter rubrisoli]QBD80462.1 hypothetical protein EPA93_32615 [Ktedonosporobacter rubrisoli]